MDFAKQPVRSTDKASMPSSNTLNCEPGTVNRDCPVSVRVLSATSGTKALSFAVSTHADTQQAESTGAVSLTFSLCAMFA